MLKICIIGNSHLAALKSGWDLMSVNYPKVRPVFFAQHYAEWAHLRVEDRHLLPHDDEAMQRFRLSSGGLQAICLDDYDAFIVHGLFQFDDFLKPTNWQQAQWKRSTGARSGDDGLLEPGDWLAPTMAGHVMRILASRGKPVVASPMPQKMERIVRHPHPPTSGYYRSMLGDDGAPVSVISGLLARWHGQLAEPPFVDQPPKTLDAAGLFTPARFRTDLNLGPLANVDYPEAEDCSHMNGAFGRHMLRHLIPACRRSLGAG